MKIPRRKPPAAMALDLTPMIDVTFMLLIFFLVATTFRQVERRLAVELPLDEGPSTGGGPPPAEVVEVKLDWQAPVMQYSVSAGVGRSVIPVGEPVLAGTLGQLMQDRTKVGYPHVSTVSGELATRLREASLQTKDCSKILIDVVCTDPLLEERHPESSSPWGFTALAVSACVEFNNHRSASGKPPVAVVFRNRLPDRWDRAGNGR